MEENKQLAPENLEEKKLTLNKWVKGIVHYKWWVIGATLGLGIVGALGTQIGLNRMTEKFTANYSYNLATITDEEGVERFVDGTLFNYASIVSKENMEAVKAENEDFSSINVDNLVKNNAISVSRTIDYKTDSSGNVLASSKIVTYNITARAKFFPSKNVGKDFIQALIYSPKESSSTAIARFNVTNHISSLFPSLSYNKKVNAIRLQDKAISSIYETLEDKFGGYVIVSELGDTLAQVSSDFASNTKAELLASSLYANGYVDYVSGSEEERIAQIKEEAEASIKTLESKQNELNVAKELLQTMQSATMISTLQSESEYSKELIKLKNQIASLSSEIDGMIKDLHWAGYYLNSDDEYVFDSADTKNACYQLSTLDSDWVTNNTDFNISLAAVASALEAERQEATAVFRYLYNHYNNGVSVLNSGYVQVKGNISWVIGLAFGLIVGFLVTSFVTGEVEVNYVKKEKESK